MFVLVLVQTKADVDELAVQCVCAVELATSVLELTGLRTRVHRAVFAVGPVDAPLVRLRVVEAQSQSLDVAARTIEFDLDELRVLAKVGASDERDRAAGCRAFCKDGCSRGRLSPTERLRRTFPADSWNDTENLGCLLEAQDKQTRPK